MVNQPARLGIRVVITFALLTLSHPGSGVGAPPNRNAIPAGLTPYTSPYYDVYSDLEPDRVPEVLLRVTRMAEEYHERTKEFSGVIRNKFPFFLFKNQYEYETAGGLPGSAGIYQHQGDGGRLLAVAGEANTSTTWQVVQHEGFHQFAHAVIGGELPPWLNEGLAEYFGEGIFTGDGMVTGVVPPRRCHRVQESIREKRLKPIRTMMTLSQKQWNLEIDIANYDMAWSMVHFLAHGDGGKYQAAFAAFVRDLGHDRPWDQAWEKNFGSAEGFEKKWSEWWLKLDPMATKDLHVRATVAGMTSFIGRAATQKQTFNDIEDLARHAGEGTVKVPKDDWLPPSLITDVFEMREQFGSDVKYEIGRDPKATQVIATLADNVRIIATYNKGAKAGAGRVTIVIDDMAAVLARARALLAEKKKPEAKALLLDVLKRNPKSPLADEARAILKQAY